MVLGRNDPDSLKHLRGQALDGYSGIPSAEGGKLNKAIGK